MLALECVRLLKLHYWTQIEHVRPGDGDGADGRGGDGQSFRDGARGRRAPRRVRWRAAGLTTQ